MEQIGLNEVSFLTASVYIKSFLKFIISKMYILFIMSIFGAIIGFLYSNYSKSNYKGVLTFVLSTESKPAGIAGLASQFGLDLGSNSGGDLFSGDNIITLFQSRKMIKAVLFKHPPQNNDILANIIVKEWKWDVKWIKNEKIKKLFPFPTNPYLLNPIQDSLISEIYNNIVLNYLSVGRTDKKLSVYILSTTSSNELFACYLTKYLMDQTADFYINTKTSIAKNNLFMLQKEADSLRKLLGGTIVSNASEADRTFNLNPALQIQRSSIQKGQINASVLGTAYGEVVKNLELAKINLQRETPLYQIIDSPELPLKRIRVSFVFGILTGAFIAFFLTLLILSAINWRHRYF